MKVDTHDVVIYCSRLIFGMSFVVFLFFASLVYADTGDGRTSSAAVPLAADTENGEAKSKACIACHGPEGISAQDNYPHLHGQRKTYLLRQMRNFRDGGDRKDPIMTPMLKNMSDQDLVDLAEYYSSFGKVLGSVESAENGDEDPMPSPATATSAASAVPAAAAVSEQGAAVEQSSAAQKAAACAACHGIDGRGTSPQFPNLTGQKAEYIAKQLKAFRDGSRQDPMMAPLAQSLSDGDIAELADYYAAMQ